MAEKPMKLVFKGSYMDGVSDPEDGGWILLHEWANLELTEEQKAALWDAINVTDLIHACPSAELLIDDEFDADTPGQSDTFYSVCTHDDEKLAKELQKKILRIAK
jgi:hypothetical protein